MFILMNMWMIGKSLMKHNYLKKKNFVATQIWKILQMQIKCMQKEFMKTLKQNIKVNILIYILKADVFENLIKMGLKIYHLSFKLKIK